MASNMMIPPPEDKEKIWTDNVKRLWEAQILESAGIKPADYKYYSPEDEKRELIELFKEANWTRVTGKKWIYHNPKFLFEEWTNEQIRNGVTRSKYEKMANDWMEAERKRKGQGQTPIPVLSAKPLEFKKLPCPSCDTILEHKKVRVDYNAATQHILKCPKCGWEVEAGITRDNEKRNESIWNNFKKLYDGKI